MRLISRPLPGMLVLEDRAHYRPARLLRPLLLPRTNWRPRAGLDIEQANLSFSERPARCAACTTSSDPSAETKIVTCLQGALHDVVLDLRPSRRPSGAMRRSSYAGEPARRRRARRAARTASSRCADDTSLLYLVTAAYDPARERGVRWDDPAFAIAWPFRTARHLRPRRRAIRTSTRASTWRRDGGARDALTPALSVR